MLTVMGDDLRRAVLIVWGGLAALAIAVVQLVLGFIALTLAWMLLVRVGNWLLDTL